MMRIRHERRRLRGGMVSHTIFERNDFGRDDAALIAAALEFFDCWLSGDGLTSPGRGTGPAMANDFGGISALRNRTRQEDGLDSIRFGRAELALIERALACFREEIESVALLAAVFGPSLRREVDPVGDQAECIDGLLLRLRHRR